MELQADFLAAAKEVYWTRYASAAVLEWEEAAAAAAAAAAVC